MIEINWGELDTEDVVSLTDCIELAIMFDNQDGTDWFNKGHFEKALKEAGYASGEAVDELVPHFENAVRLASQRRLWLGESYPFAGGAEEVRFVPTRDYSRWMTYLYLLACSNHNFIASSGRRFTTGFEEISKEAMKAAFNESAEVFLFSQFSEDRSRIGRSARDAVKELAGKLRGNITDESKIPNTQQEFGIDIVAIDAIEDSLSPPFAAFAQCTIGKNWEGKRHEAQPRHRLSAYIQLKAEYSNFLFIPHFPRDESGEWSVDLHATTNCLLRDRLSICKMIDRLRSFRKWSAMRNVSKITRQFFLDYSQ